MKHFFKFRDFLKSVWNELGQLLLALVILVVLFVFYVLFRTYLPTNSLKIVFLDVGQGDSIYIESPTRTRVLIDGGPKSDTAAKLSKYTPFFDKQFDLVIPTHADLDHITGLIEVFNRYDVRAVTQVHATSTTGIFAVFEKKGEGTVYPGHTGDVIDIGDGATLTILFPRKGTYFGSKDTNDSSTVVLLSYQGYTFLLTGDLSIEHEDELISSGLMPRNITVLKAGHHGSKTSTGDALLSYTKPKYVVISAGADNKYGHPNPETLARIVRVGSEVVSTIDHGNIEFVIERGNLKIETEK